MNQKGGFSLLFREEALSKTESGKYPIIPGDADNSNEDKPYDKFLTEQMAGDLMPDATKI